MAVSMQSVALRESRALALVQGTPLEQFATGRSCEHPSCTTRLSQYNPSTVCGAHNGWRLEAVPRTRRRRTAVAPD